MLEEFPIVPLLFWKLNVKRFYIFKLWFVETIEGFTPELCECNTILSLEEVRDGIVFGGLHDSYRAVDSFLEVFLWFL